MLILDGLFGVLVRQVLRGVLVKRAQTKGRGRSLST